MTDTFTLVNGTTVQSSDVAFNSSNYQFVYLPTSTDITTQLRIADKKQFPDFDPVVYNQIVYVQHYKETHGGATPPDVGSTSIWDNFVSQITTDPLGAPLQDLNNVLVNTASDVITKPLVILGLVVIGAAALLYFGLVPMPKLK